MKMCVHGATEDVAQWHFDGRPGRTHGASNCADGLRKTSITG